jgi:hypothetical protein
MPNLGPTTLGKLRKDRHALRGWLSIFKGTSVCSGTLTFTIVDYPTSNIIVSVTAGSIANIERGAEVIITDASNNYKGRLRIRRGGTISSTILPVAEVSQAQVTLVSGDKFSVLNEHRIRPVIPSADETFSPDQQTYTDQNKIIPPMAITGGPVCAWVDPGQTYATIDFDGSASYNVDPDGGSITHSWSFPGGGVSTSPTPTGVQIPVGEHWVKHTVTTNSRSWTQYVPVRVHNATNPPYEVLVESLTGTLQDGWSATFNMFESLGQDVAPDGALVVFWVEEIIDKTVQSFGSKGRSTSKFVGWLRSDTTTSNAAEKRLSLTAISSLARLGEIYGSSKAMIDSETPTSWSEIDELSVKTAIAEILRWYTTFTDVCDLAFDFTDYPYPRFPLQKTTPPEMVRELADAADSRITCDRNGRVEVQLRPELTPRTDRGAMTTTTTIAEQDVIDLTIQREHSAVVDLLECRGLTQMGAPFFSRYPGMAPGEGSSNTINDKLIVISQSDLNTRCGLRGAFLDKVYINTSGIKNQAPSATLGLFGAYDVFDFYREWVAFNLDETTNWRETDLTAFRWMLQSVTIEYLNGTATVTLQLQAETGAPPGQTYTPPAPDPTTIPDYTPDLPYFPSVPGQQGYMPLTDNILAITIDGHLLATTNFTDTTPVWTDTDISADIAADVVVMRVDPRSPCYLGTGAALNAWVMSLDGIYYIEDAESGTPTVTNQFLFPATLSSWNRAGLDIDYTNDAGRFGTCVFKNGVNDQGWSTEMFDGATWNAGSQFEDSPIDMGFYNVTIDPHLNHRVYTLGGSAIHFPAITVYVGDGSPGDPDEDYFSSPTNGFGVYISSMYFQYAINPSRYLWGSRDDGGGASRLIAIDILSKTMYGGVGATIYDVPPVRKSAFVISSPSSNANKLMYAADFLGHGSIQYTENALDFYNIHWTTIGLDVAAWNGCAMVDPDGDGAYLFGFGAIYFWTGGTTILDKSGTGFTASDIIGIAGF